MKLNKNAIDPIYFPTCSLKKPILAADTYAA